MLGSRCAFLDVFFGSNLHFVGSVTTRIWNMSMNLRNVVGNEEIFDLWNTSENKTLSHINRNPKKKKKKFWRWSNSGTLAQVLPFSYIPLREIFSQTNALHQMFTHIKISISLIYHIRKYIFTSCCPVWRKLSFRFAKLGNFSRSQIFSFNQNGKTVTEFRQLFTCFQFPSLLFTWRILCTRKQSKKKILFDGHLFHTFFNLLNWISSKRSRNVSQITKIFLWSELWWKQRKKKKLTATNTRSKYYNTCVSRTLGPCDELELKNSQRREWKRERHFEWSLTKHKSQFKFS